MVLILIFFFGGRLKEWIDGGTAVVTASKTTYGNSVRLEIEAILPMSAVVVWRVDSVVIGGKSEIGPPISQGKGGGGGSCCMIVFQDLLDQFFSQ